MILRIDAQQLQQGLDVGGDVLRGFYDLTIFQRPLLLHLEIHGFQAVGDGQIFAGIRSLISRGVGIFKRLRYIIDVGSSVGVVAIEVQTSHRREGTDPPVVLIQTPRGRAFKLFRPIAALQLAVECKRHNILIHIERRAGSVEVALIVPDLGGLQRVPLTYIRIVNAEAPSLRGFIIFIIFRKIGKSVVRVFHIVGIARDGLHDLIGILFGLAVRTQIGHVEREIRCTIAFDALGVGIFEILLQDSLLCLIRSNLAALDLNPADLSADAVATRIIFKALVQRQRDVGILIGLALFPHQIRPVPDLLDGDLDKGRSGVGVEDLVALAALAALVVLSASGRVAAHIALRRTGDIPVAFVGSHLDGRIAVHLAAVFVVAGQPVKAVRGIAVFQSPDDNIALCILIRRRIAPGAVSILRAPVQLDVHRRQILVQEPAGQTAPMLAPVEGHRAHAGVDDGALISVGAGDGAARRVGHGLKDILGAARGIIGRLLVRVGRHKIGCLVPLRAGLEGGLSDRIEVFVAVLVEQRQIAEGAFPVPFVDLGVPQAVHHDQLRLLSLLQGLAILVHALAVEGQHDVRAQFADGICAVIAPHLVDEDLAAARARVGELCAHQVVRVVVANHVLVHDALGDDGVVAPAEHAVDEVHLLGVPVLQSGLLQGIAVDHALIVVFGQVFDLQLRVGSRRNLELMCRVLRIRNAVLIDGEDGGQLLFLLRHVAQVPGLADLNVHRTCAQVGRAHGGAQRICNRICVGDLIDVLGGGAGAGHSCAIICSLRLAASRLAVGDGNLAHEVVGGIPFWRGITVGNRRGIIPRHDPLVVLLQRDGFKVLDFFIRSDISSIVTIRDVIQLHPDVAAMEQIVVVQPVLLNVEGHELPSANLVVDELAGGHLVLHRNAVLQLDFELIGGVPLVVETVVVRHAVHFDRSIGVLRAGFIVLGQALQQPGGLGRFIYLIALFNGLRQFQRTITVDLHALRQLIRHIDLAVSVQAHHNAAGIANIQRRIPGLLDLELGGAHQLVRNVVGIVVIFDRELVLAPGGRGNAEVSVILVDRCRDLFAGPVLDLHLCLAHAIDILLALVAVFGQIQVFEGGGSAHQLGTEVLDGLGDRLALAVQHVLPLILARNRALQLHGDRALEALNGLGHPGLAVVHLQALLLEVRDAAAVEHVALQCAGIFALEVRCILNAANYLVIADLSHRGPEVRHIVVHHGDVVSGRRHVLQHVIDIERAVLVVLGQEILFTHGVGDDSSAYIISRQRHAVHALHRRGVDKAALVDGEAVEVEGHLRAIALVPADPVLLEGKLYRAPQRADGQAVVVDSIVKRGVRAAIDVVQIVILLVRPRIVAVILRHVVVDLRINAGVARQARDGHRPVVDTVDGIARHKNVLIDFQRNGLIFRRPAAVKMQQPHPVVL